LQGSAERKICQYIADQRFFFPYQWGTVFSAPGQVGYIQQVGGEEIPIDERFFLGGINTLRGFKSREVGPRDEETGDFTGGDKEAYFNLEYIFPLLKDMGLKGVVFFDTGNAGEDGTFFGDALQRRRRHPLVQPHGTLRLEWGYNLKRRTSRIIRSSSFPSVKPSRRTYVNHKENFMKRLIGLVLALFLLTVAGAGCRVKLGYVDQKALNLSGVGQGRQGRFRRRSRITGASMPGRRRKTKDELEKKALLLSEEARGQRSAIIAETEEFQRYTMISRMSCSSRMPISPADPWTCS
jgi:hypothetical protein